jgi:predicted amidohydrolase
VRGLLSAQTPSPTQAVLRALAPEAELWMHVTFAAVARRCRATVVGGSFLRARADGAVTNTSCTYDPEGRCVATTDKVNLVPGLEDRRPGGLGLARGRAAAVPVVDAGWGRLATAICYDGFVEPHTRDERFEPVPPRLDAACVDVVANPAANPWPWHAPWVHAEPAPADRGADGVAVISRAEQWAREGLPAALAAMRHARWGVTAHLVARVLDVAFEGASEILRRDGDRVAVVARAAAHDAGEAVTAVVGVAAPGGRA